VVISTHEFDCRAGFICFISRDLLVFNVFRFVALKRIYFADRFFQVDSKGVFNDHGSS